MKIAWPALDDLTYVLYVFYAVGAVVLFRVFRRPMRKVQKKTFAVMMNLIANRYNIKMNKYKEELFSGLHNISNELRKPLDILEIGAGSGANFKYYPKRTNVMCVEPNPYFEGYLRTNSEQFPHVNLREVLTCRGEDMSPLLNSSVDVVVCTLVLCSVEDVAQCLQEVRRVLRPGGQFYFLEHIAADKNTLLRRIQILLTPLWKMAADGCHLNRDIGKQITEAGFACVNMKTLYPQSKGLFGSLTFPPIIRTHAVGFAVK